MIIKINEYSDVPIYLQIRNQIVMGISSGELAAGEQLPTVRALSMAAGWPPTRIRPVPWARRSSCAATASSTCP